MSKDFNKMRIEVESMDGGSCVTSQLILDGESSIETVSERREIVAGKPGTAPLNARVRRAIKRLAEAAFPKPPKAEAVEDPNQQKLAGVGD